MTFQSVDVRKACTVETEGSFQPCSPHWAVVWQSKHFTAWFYFSCSFQWHWLKVQFMGFFVVLQEICCLFSWCISLSHFRILLFCPKTHLCKDRDYSLRRLWGNVSAGPKRSVTDHMKKILALTHTPLCLWHYENVTPQFILQRFLVVPHTEHHVYSLTAVMTCAWWPLSCNGAVCVSRKHVDVHAD